MKNLMKFAVLAVLVLVTFVSCHECVVCHKNKICSKETVLGVDVYKCASCTKDAKDAKKKLDNAGKDLKKSLDKAAKDVKKAVN